MLTINFLQKTFVQSKVLTLITFLFLCGTSFGQLNVKTSKTNATYNTGQSAVFNVTSNTSGTVTWDLKYDDYAPTISSGSFYLSAGQTKTIPHFSSEAGVVICEVRQYSNRAVAAAAFSPFDIDPFEPEPSDFDSFWNGKKSSLAGVSLNPNVTFYQTNTYSKTYRVRLNNVDNRRVYGYLTVPNGGGPFPAIVELPPYGTVPNLANPAVNLAEQAGVITLSISIHNVQPNQVDPNAYLPDNYADKNQNYYRWGILGAIQAINYIYTRSDFNGTDVGVAGVSQGAGLAAIVAGMDNRVKALMMSNPVLSQNSGLHHNRAGGFPNYVKNSRDNFGTSSHENATVSATRYYDAMFHAKRYQGPVYINLSYEDLVTPAATGFATVNQFPGKKIVIHSTDLDHSHPFEYWIKRQDFLRRLFPSTLTTHSFPYSSNDQGYWIDAGNNQSVSGNSANLNASIKKNGSNNPNFIRKWEKISGPGNVSFSSNSYNSTATFSSSGTYVLQFSGVDEAQLNSNNKYFTLSDRVTITVGSGGGGGGTNNGAPTATLSTSSNNVSSSFSVNASFSESVTGFVLNDLVVTNGTASNLNGNNSSYSFTITPSSTGTVTVRIPQYKFLDNQGNANSIPSNTLSVNYTSSGGGGGGNNNGSPTATLSTSSNNVNSSFTVNASFSESVIGFVLSDLAVTNGTASNLNGNNNSYSFTITPSANGTVTVQIPQYKFLDNQGNANSIPSNTLSVNYSSGGGGGGGTDNCNNPTNIALNKPTSQTSTQFGASSSRAVDGNKDGDFWNGNSVSLTNWTNNPWWQVDLGQVSEIKDIKIWNRTDCCQNSLKNYHIFISNVPFNSTNLNNTINQNGVQNIYRSSTAGSPTTISINGTGRYVRIQLAGQGFLGLTEVEIFGCGGSSGGGGGNNNCTGSSNIALNGTAKQVSTNFSANASKAIDGNREGNFWNAAKPVSITNWTNNAWWEIDLGAVANIDDVKIWGRTDCCANILKDYYVFVSDVPFNSTNLNNTINQSGVSNTLRTSAAGRPSTISINRTGRYLRIQLKEQGYVALAEVEIFGCIPNTINNNTNTLIAQPDALQFEVTKVDRHVELGWSTNTEFVNDYFILEKSTDGENFETWRTTESRSDDLGFHFYNEMDEAPGYGKNYYRLIQVAKNGDKSVSEIQEVEFDINLHGFSIYPNPATEKLFVNLDPFLGQKLDIQIFDARGVLMLNKEVDQNNSAIHQIDLANYNNGLYLVALKVNGLKMETKQFIVARKY